MQFYTDAELVALYHTRESELVERKRSGADRRAIRRNVCAFANDLPGAGRPGVVFIGLEDDGACAGIDVSDDLLTDLAQIHTDGSTQPIPMMRVERQTIDGCEVAVVQVAPSTAAPVYYSKRVWVKVGPTVQEASEQEVQRLHERRLAADQPYDLTPVWSASIEHLDLDFIRSVYLPSAVHEDILAANHRSLEKQLASLRLAVHDRPARGALITMGADPQRWSAGGYIQFVRFAGRELAEPILDQKVLTGRVDDLLRALEEIIRLNIQVRLDLSGSRHVELPDYPFVALRELAHNAVMHRSYDGTNAPIHLYWYEDRVEIRSPGGLYGQVTSTNFDTGIVDYRNPLIAEIMHHLGYAQRFGLGIGTARRALQQNDNPAPEFDFFDMQVAVTVRKAP